MPDMKSISNLAVSSPVTHLLSIGKDHKTIKGEKFGVQTGVIYLAPGSISGYEMCPSRTKGCSASCLFTAGKGRYSNVQAGRIRRTLQFVYKRDEFMAQLVKEIVAGAAKAVRRNMIFAIRLNGTSDIAYERIPVMYNGVEHAHIFDAFPHIQFYDYTKCFSRLNDVAGIKNYNITFSYAETEKSHSEAAIAINMGICVAAVFEQLPETFLGTRVIDGDETDVRFWDAKTNGQAVVVGLAPKGKAKHDITGFVIRKEN